jgi:hypothetical protein
MDRACFAEVDVDPSCDVETLRDAVAQLTQKLAASEAEVTWLRRELESIRAWYQIPPAYSKATGHL